MTTLPLSFSFAAGLAPVIPGYLYRDSLNPNRRRIPGYLPQVPSAHLILTHQPNAVSGFICTTVPMPIPLSFACKPQTSSLLRESLSRIN